MSTQSSDALCWVGVQQRPWGGRALPFADVGGIWCSTALSLREELPGASLCGAPPASSAGMWHLPDTDHPGDQMSLICVSLSGLSVPSRRHSAGEIPEREALRFRLGFSWHERGMEPETNQGRDSRCRTQRIPATRLANGNKTKQKPAKQIPPSGISWWLTASSARFSSRIFLLFIGCWHCVIYLLAAAEKK